MISKRLVDAANDITHGDAERVPVVVMTEELGRYLELASRAQVDIDAGNRDDAMLDMRSATNSMHARLLPAAAALDRVSRSAMDARYDRAQAASRAYEIEAEALRVRCSLASFSEPSSTFVGGWDVACRSSWWRR